MSRRKAKSGKLSVFKGREARLNKAIFQTLALKGPQTIYDIHKQIRICRKLRYVKYASVNKRVRVLEETGYLIRVGVKNTRAGFKAHTYELSTKSYLAIFLDSIILSQLIARADDDHAETLLATFFGAMRS